MPSVYAGLEDLSFIDLATGLPPAVTTSSFSLLDTTLHRSLINASSSTRRTGPWERALSTGWLSIGWNRQTGNITNGAEVVRINTASGTGIIRLLAGASSALTFERWNGSSWQSIGSAGTLPIGISRWTVHWHRASSGGVYSLRLGGTEVAAFSGDTSGDPATEATFAGTFSSGGGWAEVIVADEECSSWRLAALPPNGNGTYQEQASGDYSSIDEVAYSDLDLVSLAVDGDRFSAALGDVPGVIENMEVESVWVAARARRDGSGPQSLELGLRYGGSDSYASPAALDTTYGQFHARISGPTLAQLNAAELLLRADT